MFSSWKHNADGAAERLLHRAGWNRPEPGAYPTGGELVERYLEPLAKRTVLAEHIRTHSRVTAITRVGFDKVKTPGRNQAPFELRLANGRDVAVTADAVIDASGTWLAPSPAGANGLSALGEAENGARIAYGMPDVLGRDRAHYVGKRVAVLGSGHSAIGTLIDLARLADDVPTTQPLWLLRGDDPQKAFGGGADDQLPERSALGSMFAGLVRTGRIAVERGFRLTEIRGTDKGLHIIAGSGAGRRSVQADALIVAAGFRPDFSFLRELRIDLDPALECPPALAPLIDPNVHSCGTVRPHGARELAQPEPGFYFAGMKSYGRAPTFLTMTGYEQVRSIVAEIAGDHEAAQRVELVLPETGVCAGPGLVLAATDCCGGQPANDDSACCRADEVAKAQGDTVFSACQKFKVDVLERGADATPYIIGAAARDGYPCVNLAPDGQVLERRDVLVIDTGSTFEGYYCDFDREFAMGPVSAATRDAYRRVWNATEAGLAAVKPWQRTCDVWSAMAEELGASDVQATGIGRLGHGLGLRMCEAPSIGPKDETLLAPGMVITLEPGISYAVDGSNGPEKRVEVHEEDVLVTDTGAELLTRRAPREIPVVDL